MYHGEFLPVRKTVQGFSSSCITCGYELTGHLFLPVPPVGIAMEEWVGFTSPVMTS